MRAFSPVDEPDALAPHGFEARQVDIDSILAGSQAGHGVNTPPLWRSPHAADSSGSR